MTKKQFLAVVKKHRETLCKTLIKMFKISYEDAEDLVHTGIAELLDKEKYKTFRGESKPLTWLVGSLKITYKRWRRKKSKRVLGEDLFKPRTNEADPLDTAFYDLLRTREGGGRRLRNKREREMLARSLVQTIPKDIRYVLSRLFLEDATWAEVAAELRVEERSLRSRIYRYLRKRRDAEQNRVNDRSSGRRRRKYDR